MKLTNQQIGRCGEILVQQKLLLHGIESAPLTTDSGVDLVAYSPKREDALAILVKTNLKAKPGGGKGKPHLDWWVPEVSPANLFAFVDLERNRVWVVKTSEIPRLAQQHPPGWYHFFMSVDPTSRKREEMEKQSTTTSLKSIFWRIEFTNSFKYRTTACARLAKGRSFFASR